MEIIKYLPCHQPFLSRLLLKTVSGEQQLGYPRLHSFGALEKEYAEYPDSSMANSVYILTHNANPVGAMGLLRDGSYSVLWGPVTLQSIYYKTAIRLSILFAKEIIPKEFHVFVHNLNIEYRTELEKLGGKLRSIQHVMSFDWLKNAPTPLDFAYIAYLSSGQLAESKILLDDTINLLRDGFPHVDNTRDLIEELLYSKCNFVLYIFNKRALGVLIANENFANEVRIEYLAVSKSYRRLGIATKLLQYLLQKVYETHGFCNVNLTHDNDNSVAHSVYLKNGFFDETIYKEFIISC